MKYLVAATALVSSIPGIWSMTINTPTGVTQCQPVLLTWSDGQAPYYLSIIPGGQAAAEPLKTFPAQSGNSMTWIADLAAGTKVTFAQKDNTGAMAYTDIVTIRPGQDSSCLSGSNNPPAPQQVNYASVAAAADSVSSVASTSAGVASAAPASSSSRVTLSAAGTMANRPTNAATQAVQTNNQQASVSSARPSGTAPASAGTGSTGASTSGAQTRFAVGTSLVLAGGLGLLGAALL